MTVAPTPPARPQTTVTYATPAQFRRRRVARQEQDYLRWRPALDVGELGCRAPEVVWLDEAHEGESEVEVAFVMWGAARKTRTRVAHGGGDRDGEAEAGAMAGVGARVEADPRQG